MIVRKDNPLIFPILFSKKQNSDIRDMPGATWRDVVAAVLEEKTEAVPLSYLYEHLAEHKKAKQNKWWKEKIRQTLQYNPAYFVHTERGMWKLSRTTA